MARFLEGLFETKASPKASDAIARATGSSPIGYYAGVGIGQVGQWDIDKAVRDGVEKVTWIFRCVDVIAQKQSTLPMVLRNHYDRSEGELIDDKRLHRLLNFRSNTYETAQQFRYRVSAVGLLSRRGVFIEIVKGRDGRPSELHILPPGATRPIPDPRTFVAGYEITRGDGKIETLEKDRVIWAKFKPHPTDPYAQMTPLMSAGIAAETDYLAHMFNRNFLGNDGRPGMLITIDGKVDPETAKELKARFEGGPGQAGRVSVMEGAGVNVADTTASPRDTQWGELLAKSKEEILMAFGVPESVMGNASGRTFDNADAERENFYLDTMLPHCDSFASGLDPLTGDMDDDIVLAFDYSNVDILQRMAQRKREEKRAEVAMGVATIDDYFEATGKEPWDVVGTRVLYHTSGLAIAKNPDDQAGIMTLKPIGTPPDPEGGNTAQAAREGAQLGAAAAQRSLSNIMGARALALSGGRTPTSQTGAKGARARRGKVAHTSLGRAGRVERKSLDDDDPERVAARAYTEGQIEGIIQGWDDRQAEVIPDRLNHVKSRKGTRHWDGEGTEHKALDPKYGVDSDRWVRELSSTMQSTLRRVVKREANGAARRLRDTGILDRISNGRSGTALTRVFGTQRDVDAELGRVMGATVNVVENAAKAQMRRLEARVAKMDAAGASMTDIQKEIRRSIGQRSQWRRALATNVTTSAFEGAQFAVYEKAARFMEKVWHCEHDEKTRVSHRLADGQARRPSSRFRVGKTWLRFPGDPDGPAEETANCRCYVTYQIRDSFYGTDLPS